MPQILEKVYFKNKQHLKNLIRQKSQSGSCIKRFVPNAPFLCPKGRERVYWEQMG